MVIMLLMNVHISLILWRIAMSYPEARTLFELASKASASAGSDVQAWTASTASTVQYLYIFGMLGLYSLSFGKALGMMFYQVRWCLPRWMMVGCLLMLPFYATSRRLGAWTSSPTRALTNQSLSLPANGWLVR